jgi:hypothetical protein
MKQGNPSNCIEIQLVEMFKMFQSIKEHQTQIEALEKVASVNKAQAKPTEKLIKYNGILDYIHKTMKVLSTGYDCDIVLKRKEREIIRIRGVKIPDPIYTYKKGDEGAE